MKKTKALFFALLLTFAIPVSTFASEFENYGAGEWDVIYNNNITATTSGTNTSTFTSGGGDIRVCVSGVESGNTVTLQFYKSTGSSILPLMFVDNINGSGPSSYSCLPKIDIRPYVNSNGKVNLYLKAISKNKSSDSIRVVVED